MSLLSKTKTNRETVMDFYPEHIYHVYNRGNNQQKFFFKRDHYIFFIGKMRSCLLKHCDMLAYCLMPNHFHMLIYTGNNSTNGSLKNQRMLSLSRAFGTLQSSYTRAVNQDRKRTGSLFQQKTKAKELNLEKTRPATWSRRTSRSREIGRTTPSRLTNNDFYPVTCFHYIHQNPLKAGLVDSLEEWEFSSYPDYTGLRNGTLCNQYLVRELLDVPEDKERFRKQSYELIGDSISEKFMV